MCLGRDLCAHIVTKLHPRSSLQLIWNVSVTRLWVSHSQFTATFYFNADHQFDLKWTYYAFPYFMSYTVTVLDAHTEHGHGVYSFPTIGSVWCKGMSLCGLLRHSIRAFSDWLHVVAAIIWSSRGWASSLIRLFVIWDSTQLVVF